MDCSKSLNLMSAYIDDELDSSIAIVLATHLANCSACDNAYERMLNLRTTIKQHTHRHVAPTRLRHRIQADIDNRAHPGRKLAKLPWAWINLGAAGACSLALAVTLALYLEQPSAAEQLNQEIIASHYRSLMASHLTDVALSDQQSIKPWFAGKLDFSPPVHELAQQGFPLIGGRLDYLNQRPVAALAYRHNEHLLNLFVWPERATRDTPPQITSMQGYQLMHWARAGMNYWVVSDMHTRKLMEFQRALAAQSEKEVFAASS